MGAKKTRMIRKLFLYICLSCVLGFGAIAILASGGGGGGGEATSTGEVTGDTGTDGGTANPPSPPTGVIAVAGEGAIILSWESVADADSYTVYWSATSGVTKLQCTMILNITSQSYTHTGLTSGVTYYYVVTAVSSTGESNESSEVSATPTGDNSWATITLDNHEDAGAHNSIAVDSRDRVHISYYDLSGNLGYATNASGAWAFETIDIEHGIQGYTAIALDSNDKVHISYGATDGLRYATNASGAWVTSTKDSLGDMGMFTSIALDSNDKVHISYYDLHNRDLKYATNASGAWAYETVDSGGDVGMFTSLALDSNDKVHISYNGNGNVRYATNASGTWALESVVTEINGYYRTSLAVDSSDYIHISYHDANNDKLGYATNASGTWASETIMSFEQSLYGYNSIALDSADNAHISYYDDDTNSMTYTTNASGTWVFYEIDTVGGTQTHNSIAVDSNDCVHISYYNNTYLRYVTNCPSTMVPSFQAPTGVEANPGEESIVLNWLSIPEAIAYNIYWATSSGVSTTTYEGVISCVTTTSYTHTGLADNTYYYVVTAETIYGEGDASGEVNAIPYTDTVDGGDGGDGSGCPTYSDLCYCDDNGCSYGGTVLASCGCPEGTSQYGDPIYIGGVEYLQCVCDY